MDNEETSINMILSDEEQSIWDTDQVFKSVSEWEEDDGVALFFKLDAGEIPEVTSPIHSNWDGDYFTHWMPIPKELMLNTDYRQACIKSGIKTVSG